jgi:hypothetical protein
MEVGSCAERDKEIGKKPAKLARARRPACDVVQEAGCGGV